MDSQAFHTWAADSEDSSDGKPQALSQLSNWFALLAEEAQRVCLSECVQEQVGTKLTGPAFSQQDESGNDGDE